jgi:hypothetical protein
MLAQLCHAPRERTTHARRNVIFDAARHTMYAVSRSGAPQVATVLDKELKRQVTVDGVDYIVAVDPAGLRLTGKGKRKPEVELRWRDLLSGDAAMAVALNASLSKTAQAANKPATERPPDRARKRAPKKPAR